jgi:eukaryotic-like serine/threonine-protein kinase
MEFVEGGDFLTYVRAAAEGSRPEPTVDVAESSPRERGASAAGTTCRSLSASQAPRLREALRQLAMGVEALHEKGKLHRDIKPSNVLVTPAGRVVLLDFGLAAELDSAGLLRDSEEFIVGTVSYMAPEQAAGKPVSPAGDWYSVGAMLYEALTGVVPFRGTAPEVLRRKQVQDPPAPREVLPGVSEDLSALCVELLSRDPQARPSGREVLRRLETTKSMPESAPPAPVAAGHFVGRSTHLEVLRAAFQTMKTGRAVMVDVKGQSGAGKSALVQHFLEEVRGTSEAVVLAGRCYEQESVPYKALDSLVDALSQRLKRLPLTEAQAVLPRDVQPLALVFPVLRQVEAVARAPARALEAPDPHELRRRAFGALRELLARLGDRRPLVLWIDDLQWGDVDSAVLLSELVRPPDPPVLLLIGSYRSEDQETSRFLRAFFPALERADAALVRQELTVEALTPSEARELALVLLGREDASAQTQADLTVQESKGNPLFVFELVQSCLARPEDVVSAPSAEVLTLDHVLWERILGLPQPARRLLEILAVAGRPLRRVEAWSAAELTGNEHQVVAVLRSRRFIRSTGPAEDQEIETYHDRIRETTAAHLAPAARVDYHSRLAVTLEAGGKADPEVLAIHFQGAQQPLPASRYYKLAADQAAKALAFERAAKLYRLALELGSHSDKDERSLRSALGDALANAGRGADAAGEYLRASAGAPAVEGIELHRRAAFQFLTSGHVDEGLGELRAVLDAVGLKLATTPLRALLLLLWRRAQLRLRGLGFRERDAALVPAEDLSLIDITWSVSLGLGMIDPIRGSDYQARNLLLALRAGEPIRVARGLAVEAMYVAIRERKSRLRAARLRQAAEEIIRRIPDPYTLGMACLSSGMAAYLGEDWAPWQVSRDQSAQTLRESCTNVAYEVASARIFALWSLIQMGELAELSRRCPALILEAHQRGDLYAETNYRTFPLAHVHLAADTPEAARRGIREALETWSHQGYHLQHLHALFALVRVELYTGNGAATWGLIEDQRGLYAGSLLGRIQEFRVQMLQTTASAALGAAAEAHDPRPLLRAAERTACRLRREKMPAADASACYVQAAVAGNIRIDPFADVGEDIGIKQRLIHFRVAARVVARDAAWRRQRSRPFRRRRLALHLAPDRVWQ